MADSLTADLPLRLIFACCLVLAVVDCRADETAEDDQFHDLLTLLDKQTELATKTGMNADFLPGIVTILSGADLLTRGARTVWESLFFFLRVARRYD